MKGTRPGEDRRPTVITVRPSDGPSETDLIVTVPDAGADVDAIERALIAFALKKTGGNRTHAARFLGLSRSALIYRMHKHRLVEADAAD